MRLRLSDTWNVSDAPSVVLSLGSVGCDVVVVNVVGVVFSLVVRARIHPPIQTALAHTTQNLNATHQNARSLMCGLMRAADGVSWCACWMRRGSASSSLSSRLIVC